MAIKIIGATSATEADVDTTSKALKVISYNAAGTTTMESTAWSGIYGTKIEVVPSTLTAATTYFAMRNTGAKTATIAAFEVQLSFSGTAAASRSVFEIGRFNTATPTGGTAQTAIKMNNASAATSMGDLRFAPGGLTTTSVVFENPIALINVTNQLTWNLAYDLNATIAGMTLAVNEGFYIRANTAIVAGAALHGHILWAEV